MNYYFGFTFRRVSSQATQQSDEVSDGTQSRIARKSGGSFSGYMYVPPSIPFSYEKPSSTVKSVTPHSTFAAVLPVAVVPDLASKLLVFNCTLPPKNPFADYDDMTTEGSLPKGLPEGCKGVPLTNGTEMMVNKVLKINSQVS
jgi:hypothetical protein